MRLLFGMAVGMMIVAMSGQMASASTTNAMVKEVTGQAQFAVPGAADYKPLAVGASLPSGTMIKTGPDGVVVLVPVRGSALRMAPNTELTISNMDFAVDGNKVTSRKADVELNTGVVSALLDESVSPDVTDFKIHTPQGVAVARGTFFAVCVHDGKSYVKVKAGKVGVQSKTSAAPPGQASAQPIPLAPG